MAPFLNRAVVSQMADERWVMEKDLFYTDFKGRLIHVPYGFIHDWASVPRPFWWAIPPTGKHGQAAVIHDWLYWVQTCTREEADLIFLIAMLESGVGVARAVFMYRMVRRFGAKAWNKNAVDRDAGVVRVLVEIPEELVVEAPTKVQKVVRFCRGGRAA